MSTDEQSPLLGHNGTPTRLSRQQLWLTICFPYIGLLLVAMGKHND